MDPLQFIRQNRPQVKSSFTEDLMGSLGKRAKKTTQRMGSFADEFTDRVVSPLKGSHRITQKFGNVNPGLYKGITKGSRHLGLDLAAPKGTEVFAPISGRAQAGRDRHWGNYVDVTANDGTTYRFSHLSDNTNVPEAVRAGQLLGLTGSTGNSTGPHLDISVKRGGQYVDPLSIEALRRALMGGEQDGS